MSQKSKKEKFILGLSFSFLLASLLILGTKALTIGTAILNTRQIISRVTLSNNHNTDLSDVMADFNIDENGLSYFIGKLGIGTRNPQSALQVSGSIRTNEICDQTGTNCIAIADIGTGSGGGDTTIINGADDGYLQAVNLLESKHLTFNISGHNNLDVDLSQFESDPTIPSATSCISGQIIKYDGTSRSCGSDNVSDGTGGGDESSTNEIQDLSLSANTLSLSGSATTVDLSPYTKLTEDEVDDYVSNNGYLTNSNNGDFVKMEGDQSIAGEKTFQDDIIALKNVKIGGQKKTAKLEVIGTTELSGDTTISSGGNLTVDTTTLFVKASTNRVGIGTTEPSAKLEVSGNIKANAFLYSSDRRLKTNLQPLSSTLDKINKLNSYYFNRKKDGTPSMGFIAQELQKEYPLVVHENDEGYLSVDYSSMTVPLLQAVKELDAENQKLKSDLASLTKRLESIENLLKQ